MTSHLKEISIYTEPYDLVTLVIFWMEKQLLLFSIYHKTYVTVMAQVMHLLRYLSHD